MYCKLFASLYQGTLRGHADEILVFTNLLAHAAKDGTVDKHFRAIADETGLKLNEVKAAIETLEAPDPESRSHACKGARIIRMDKHRVWGWRIVNHAKYRALRTEEDRAEQNRQAQQRFRDKRKQTSEQIVSNSKQSNSGVSDGQTDKPRSAHAEAEAEAEALPHTPTGASGSREIPDWPSVAVAAQNLGLTEWRAREWFDEMETCGWIDKQSRPVRKWRPMLNRIFNYWVADGRPQKPNGRPNKNPTTSPRNIGTANEGTSSQYRNVGKTPGALPASA